MCQANQNEKGGEMPKKLLRGLTPPKSRDFFKTHISTLDSSIYSCIYNALMRPLTC